jgi:hypothetical protein
MAVRGVIVDNRVFVLGAILRRENDSEKYVYVGQVAFQIDTGSDITILSPMSLWALNIHPWEIEPARGLVTTLGGVIAPYTLSDFYLWFRDDETGLNMQNVFSS